MKYITFTISLLAIVLAYHVYNKWFVRRHRRSALQLCIDELERLSTYVDEGKSQRGICYHLKGVLTQAGCDSDMCTMVKRIVDKASKDWRFYSGHVPYPIASGDTLAAYYAFEYWPKWSDSEYGNRRRELCLFWRDALLENSGDASFYLVIPSTV